MPQMIIILALETYVKVGDIHHEIWSQASQYRISNGIIIDPRGEATETLIEAAASARHRN
jgi:hypothetical protein